MSKPHKDMTLDELQEEFIEYWGERGSCTERRRKVNKVDK